MSTNGEFDRSKEGQAIETVAVNAVKRLALKFFKKISGVVFSSMFSLISFLTTLLLPVILYVFLPVLSVTAVGFYIANIEIYDQECPELVRAFLMERYDDFEAEIRRLCDDEDFEAFVQSTEFDIGYTKMVFGGTSTYTEQELKGNIVGVQDLKSNFVTENKDGTYTANSIIADIQKYQEEGVPTSKIFINDEYLAGYRSSYIEKGEAIKFNDWIKSSYFNVPMFYWYANLQNEYGYVWDYEKDPNNGNVIWFASEAEDGKSYGEIISSDMILSRETFGNKRFNASLLPIGHKFVIEDSFMQKAIKWATNNNGPETGVKYKSFDVTDTDLYEWMYKKEKGEEKTNYEKYILDTKKIKRTAYGKREGLTNELIDNWKDKFAEYIAKELYYIYPDRQYILDYFLGDSKKSPDTDKKVAFLQRAFHAMASGSSLEVEYEESYSVENGYVINDLTGMPVGSINIADIEVKNVKMKSARWYIPEYKEALQCPNGQTAGSGHGYECKGYPFSDGYVYFKEELKAQYDEEKKEHYYCPECKTELVVPEAAYNNDTQLWADGDELKWSEFKKVFNEMKRVANKPYPSEVIYSYEMVITDKEGKSITINCTDDSGDWLTILSDDINNGKKTQRINMGLGSKRDELSEFISSTYTWDKDFYERNTVADENDNESAEVAESAKKALDSTEFSLTTNTVKLKDLELSNILNYKSKNIEKYFNETAALFPEDDKDKDGNSLVALLNANGIIKKKREPIELKYYDTSMLNWTKTEYKEGDTIKRVTYEIAMKYADVSRYDDEQGEYRIAYGFETKGAINEAINLLEYAKTNRTLKGVSNKVNFDELFIRIDNESTTGEYITNGTLVDIIMEIISKNESGDYGECHNPVFATEKYLTVGYLQWYGGRAYNILKGAIKNDVARAKSILSDELYDYISKWTQETNRNLTEFELMQLSELLKSEAGVKAQKEQAVKDIQGYINEIKNEGVTNTYVLAYLCDCNHQSPAGQDRILEKLKAEMPDFNDRGLDALNKVHEIAKNDVYTTPTGNLAGLGVYITRRDKTYQMLSIFDLESEGNYAFPLDSDANYVVTSEYGMRDGLLHKGIDIAAPDVTKIYAAKSGKVIFAGEAGLGSGYGGYGECVVIDDGTNYAIYAHMRETPQVKTGDTVEIGQWLGFVGTTGKSSGNHLHFELRQNGDIEKTFDPRTVMSIP